jgi:hypothetical protein
MVFLYYTVTGNKFIFKVQKVIIYMINRMLKNIYSREIRRYRMKTAQNKSTEISYFNRIQAGNRGIIQSTGVILLIVLLFLTCNTQKMVAQGVGISEASIVPLPSSILEVRSTQRGFLAPRMTTGERNLIAAPATGLLIYNTTTNAFNYYSGSWITISATNTILDVANGGTGSSTQNFVDLTSGQTAAGLKIWSNLGTFSAGITVSGGAINLNHNATNNITNIGTGTTTGAITIGNIANTISIPGIISGANPLVFDGAVADANRTTFAITNPTAAQTITFPNATGTVALVDAGASWLVNGNAGTNPATNFIGTTDNNDLVFRANSLERARIVSATGDLKIGDATSGTVRSTAELVMRQDGDTYGPSILRLRNRNTENGAIFETPYTPVSVSLVDFIFKTSTGVATTVQRNIRFEARATMAKTAAPSFHIGGLSPDAPTLSVGDNYAAFNRGVRIGTYPAGTVPVPPPTALLHLNAGTTTVAPLKFTNGANLSTAEDGAVEYNGTNFFVTDDNGIRYTLAKTLTTTPSLDFANTTNGNYSDVTTTVTNAIDGDVVVLGILNAAISAGTSYTAWVSSSGTVTVRFTNNSGGAINPPSRAFRISVLKY